MATRSKKKSFWGVESGRRVRLRITPLCADCLDDVGSSASHNSMAYYGDSLFYPTDLRNPNSFLTKLWGSDGRDFNDKCRLYFFMQY
jgi:hypothetical protein